MISTYRATSRAEGKPIMALLSEALVVDDDSGTLFVWARAFLGLLPAACVAQM